MKASGERMEKFEVVRTGGAWQWLWVWVEMQRHEVTWLGKETKEAKLKNLKNQINVRVHKTQNLMPSFLYLNQCVRICMHRLHAASLAENGFMNVFSALLAQRMFPHIKWFHM